jgi:hypothetical protein
MDENKGIRKAKSMEFNDRIVEVKRQSEEKIKKIMKKIQVTEQRSKVALLNQKNKINAIVLKEREAINKVLENNIKLKELEVIKQNKILAKLYVTVDKAGYKVDILSKKRQEL